MPGPARDRGRAPRCTTSVGSGSQPYEMPSSVLSHSENPLAWCRARVRRLPLPCPPRTRPHDVDSALTRAEQLGAPRVLAPVDTPVSRIAVFTDPDGNRVGLVSR